MNYEKRYTEALERARYYHSKDYMLINSAIENIFPELIKEEYLRRWLKDVIHTEYDQCSNCINDKGCVTCVNGNMKETKSEPKFHSGDWVILNGTVAQILDKQKYGFVGLDIDGEDFFCNYGHTDSMCLWTIEDTKNGDVLVDEYNNIGIYSGEKDDLYWHSCIYLGCDEYLRCAEGYHERKNTKPATKEQCDLLFQKMKDAGYEWDAERKELKKMEVANKESEDEKIGKEILQYIKSYAKLREEKIPTEWFEYLEKQGQQKQTCS